MAQPEPQSLDSALLARVDKLEQRLIERERKLEQLETLCSMLETSNALLHSSLDEKTSYIAQLESKLDDQRAQLESVEQNLAACKVDEF